MNKCLQLQSATDICIFLLQLKADARNSVSVIRETGLRYLTYLHVSHNFDLQSVKTVELLG
jgi:hypothetical protein